MKNIIFDTHCHLADKTFDENYDTIIREMNDDNVYALVCGTNYENSLKSLSLSEKYNNIVASCGVHPTDKSGDFDKVLFEKLCNTYKPVAIGEIGLDYYWLDQREKQQELFTKQLLFAQEMNLPVIIHGRSKHRDDFSCYDDIISFLKKYPVVKKGVAHSFAGSEKQAQELIQMGYYLGFNGIITFKNAQDRRDLIKNIPLEHILIETDSPYLAPEPHRGKTNTPLYVYYIAECISKVKNLEISEVIEQTTKNACNLFNITI